MSKQNELSMNEFPVKVWQEMITIPTYETGAPDKNPMFFEKRVYQGSSGVVYPNPVIEKIFDEKKDKEYRALFLENRYLKIMILPELGGRVQMAFDKIARRHFIYYNSVIKPALVGLCGPWISGGIEFNWPQHHRPSTFEPVDFAYTTNDDGSATVWVNEVERMFRTKGMAGFTLHPDKAYLEIRVRLFNGTAFPQTFLWWANPAVKVNNHYQSVFPPDVHAVFDHGKRDVSSFPIATGTYYKVDYSPGTDISRYKNIPVPTSYMAIHSNYDFMGGYEHDSQAGVLHVANHHVSPGKKQWTWGHGDFGRAWDRNLTDEDGPYIELMAGAFTDNQPDFSWLMPYEEKSFTQYFLPYRELGLVKNASKDMLLNMEQSGNKLVVKIFATSVQKQNTLRVLKNNELLLNEQFDVSPENIYTNTITVDPDAVNTGNVRILITDISGKEILCFEPGKNRENKLPEPARAALLPAELESNEQLYLTGLHLEQYRHATYNPVPYYEEALNRDPGDIRNNNALGLWYMRRGQFTKSEPFFRKAIETLTQRNPNPYDGEPYYNLGSCLKWQGRLHEAYDAFYKAAWNNAWKDSSYFSLAQIDMANGHYEQALEHVLLSLDRNARNNKARALHMTILRKLERYNEALQAGITAVEKDKFNLSVYFEQYMILKLQRQEVVAKMPLNELGTLARGNVNNYIEFALDYAAAGLPEDAIEWMRIFGEEVNSDNYPMVQYYLGYWYHKCNRPAESAACLAKAVAPHPVVYFPNRLEDIAVLQFATTSNPGDARAPYYLGNLWYDKRQYDEAIEQWEISARRDESFATVHRNLGIAYFNKRNDPAKAEKYYEKAFYPDTSDARVLMELDQLYKRLNRPADQRLSLLEEHLDTVLLRDDLYLERVALYNFKGQFEKAYELIMQRKFHPWEGGEGKVSAQYLYCLVEMARQHLMNQQYQQAINQLVNARIYPHDLGEGKLVGAAENDIFYWLGCAYEGLNQGEIANSYFEKATEGASDPSAAMFYNDQQPDKIFYQGLAWEKLGNKERSNLIFRKLIDYGHAHLNDKISIDYFAVSLPDLLIFEDDLSLRNKVHCHYITGLGFLGIKEISKAKAAFEQVLQLDAMHHGAKTHLVAAQQLEERIIVGQ